VPRTPRAIGWRPQCGGDRGVGGGRPSACRRTPRADTVRRDARQRVADHAADARRGGHRDRAHPPAAAAQCRTGGPGGGRALSGTGARGSDRGLPCARRTERAGRRGRRGGLALSDRRRAAAPDPTLAADAERERVAARLAGRC
jgi:hypothetical protein